MLKHISLLLALSAIISSAWSAGNREDYDLDDNGLIEINDLADLNELRNNLTGKTLYGSNAGCPEGGCRGVELTADLDFDTNQDGVIDAADAYWNDGKGWDPIGGYPELPFRGFVEGNGYVFRNLYIDRPDESYVGVFGSLSDTTIRRTGIAGKLSHVRGYSLTGMLVGHLEYTDIEAVFSTGRLEGVQLRGGIAGYYLGTITSGNLFSTAKLRLNIWETGETSGGIFGFVSSGSFRSAFSVIPPVYDGGGFYDSYFVEPPDRTGNTLADLMCPYYPGDPACKTGLYRNWEQEKDSNGRSFWDFGNRYQLPGLVLNGRLFRDSDGDGYLDGDDDDADGDGVDNTEDAFPLHPYISRDSDGDGYPDAFDPACDLVCRIESGMRPDAFPNNPAAAADADGDGKPDRWNSTCDSTCQNDSGLVLDDFVEDTEPPQMLQMPTQLITTTDKFFIDLVAAGMLTYDNVESDLTFQISYADETVEQSASEPSALPLGNYAVELIAIDSAGNTSEPAVIEVSVRYEVGFAQTVVRASEGTTAKFPLVFSPSTPDFPVTVVFQVKPISATVTLQDIAIERTIFTRQFNPAAENGAVLEVPVVNDYLMEAYEPDEELQILVMQAFKTSNEEPLFVPYDQQSATLQIPANSTAQNGSSSSSSSSSSSTSGVSSSSSSSSSSSASSSSGSSPGSPDSSGGSLDWLFLLLASTLLLRTRICSKTSHRNDHVN